MYASSLVEQNQLVLYMGVVDAVMVVGSERRKDLGRKKINDKKTTTKKEKKK